MILRSNVVVEDPTEKTAKITSHIKATGSPSTPLWAVASALLISSSEMKVRFPLIK